MKKKKIVILVTGILIGSMGLGTAALAAEKLSTKSSLKCKGRIELDMNNDGDLDDPEDVLFDASDLESIADSLDEIEQMLD